MKTKSGNTVREETCKLQFFLPLHITVVHCKSHVAYWLVQLVVSTVAGGIQVTADGAEQPYYFPMSLASSYLAITE